MKPAVYQNGRAAKVGDIVSMRGAFGPYFGRVAEIAEGGSPALVSIVAQGAQLVPLDRVMHLDDQLAAQGVEVSGRAAASICA